MSDEAVLRAAAAHYYEACLLWEDEDLEPTDTLEVLRRAFRSSDCDDFAEALARATGWETVRMDWATRSGEAGHHALVRAPDGRLLDVGGWIDPKALAKGYGAVPGSVSLAPGGAMPQNLGSLDDEGHDEELARILSVVRNLPHAPYGEGWFRALAARPVAGADLPDPAAGAPAP